MAHFSDTQLYFVKKYEEANEKTMIAFYYIPVVLKSSGLVDGIIEGALDQEVLKNCR